MDAIHDSPWFFSGIVPCRMICLAAGTVLLYDHLTTLDQEVNLVWKRRLGTYGTALFLVNRYIHYIHAFSIISESWFIALSERTCLRWDIANCVLVGFSITVCEVILALRTWAMWKLSRRVLYFFLIMACVKFPVVIAALAESLIHSRYLRISDPASPAQFVCISPVIGRWSWESLAFVSIIFGETGIASLTVVRAIEARKSTSRWYFRIHYMGVIYYLFTLGLSILNVIGTLYLRNVGILPFGMLQGVIQSTFCNRVAFLAREPADLATTWINQTEKSAFVAVPLRDIRHQELDLNQRTPLHAFGTIMIHSSLWEYPLEQLSPLKVLFLLVRYAPFLYLPILLYHQFGSGLDPDTCQVIYAIVNWMFAAGLGSADLILTIRTWATLGSNRKAAYFFFPLIALIHVAILVLVGLWLRSTLRQTIDELSFPELGIGCLLESRRPILAASYILLMALDAGNLLLMVTRGIKIFKLGNGSQLSRIVYGDGIIYYDCLFRVVPSRMICLAAGTVLLYDHLTTLDQEINLVWKRRLGTYGTALFLVNRYSHYIHAFSIIGEYWFIASSERTCLRWDIANCVLVGFSITVCEVILALRTWAMWKLSRRILYFFLIMACVKFPVVIAALAESLIHSRCKDLSYLRTIPLNKTDLVTTAPDLRISNPASPPQFICISPVIGRWSWESLAFVSVIITETGIASLTVVRAIEARKSASRWYFRIHYMGVIYYIFTLGLTILNVIGTLYLRNIGVLPFGLIQGVIQCTFCNRVAFLAREPADFATTGISQTEKSATAAIPLRFRRRKREDSSVLDISSI
ncbi:hypothetical protein D9756_001015 [Leucocoprinus leucothites]|uniref:DUF6533 domain-containing protein n=1 Tax=Leucocoprinus leucothites TaxID=201217 RepID=A0A8H5GEQ2_9AGAR|nr:hypothetical protein D9756_001015 [Leucoagaricus leucothites]